jgi:FkbM family methyltransferase
VSSASRRLGRPELAAAFYGGARIEHREQIAITAVIAATLRREGVYVDIGTNRGQVLREAVRVAPEARHIAFEPIPQLAAEVSRAFPGVDCRALAVADMSGSAEFCHFRNLDGWSGLRRSLSVSDEQGDPEFITVQVSTLDEELREVSPTVVKIDVEGAELGVIEGGSAVLARDRPVLIFEHVADAAELYGVSATDLWAALEDLRYEVFAVTGAGPYDRDGFAREEGVVNWLGRPA